MREFAKSFYKSKIWQDTRNAYYNYAKGLCEECLKQGRYTVGEIVHHKEHITPENIENPEITLSFNNLELVCRECHCKLHEFKRERKHSERRYIVDAEGNVIIKK